jgi:hypothetical protein
MRAMVASRPMAATEALKSAPLSQIAVSTPPGAMALTRIPALAF